MRMAQTIVFVEDIASMRQPRAGPCEGAVGGGGQPMIGRAICDAPADRDIHVAIDAPATN